MGSRATGFGALLVLAMIVAACGGGSGTEDQQGERPPAAVQELVVGVGADPWVDGEEDGKRFPSYPLNADVCESLVQLTPDFRVEPGLATDWEFVGDNTFRFTLADGPAFPDGTPVTAEDVEFSLDYTVEEPQTSGFAFLGEESTTVVDENTLEVRPTEPNLRLIEQITHPTYVIMEPGSDPLVDRDLTCTGPFQVAEYVADERLVVERNEGYWGERPMLDQITFQFYPDDTTRGLALQNGDVDLITEVPRSIASNMADIPGLNVENAPPGQVILMYVARRDLPGSDKLLADPDLRRAVAHAMDRDAYVNGVLDGNAEVVNTVAPPTVLGEYADLVEGIPYDPDAAESLLDDAGWSLGSDGVRSQDGRRLELDLVFSPTGVDLTTMEFVQAQLAEVGIASNILRLDAGAYSEALTSGDYDLDISTPNQNDANPAFLLSLRWYSKASGDNAQIISPGPDTEFEALIDQTQGAEEFDDLQRLAAEAMHELVDEEVAGIPLAGTYRIYAMNDTVQGLEVHPSGTNQRWRTIFMSE